MTRERADVDSRSTSRWRAKLLLALATAGLALLAVVPVFQLWNARPEVPFDYRGDANFFAMTIENVIEHGSYQQSQRLGAPAGLDLHDFPQGGDNLHFAIVRALTLFTSKVGVVQNAYLLLTFPLVALCALLVLRWLGVSPKVAVVAALAYAFVPYHLHRGEQHLFLSGYFSVPLGIYLAVSACEGRALFQREARVPWLSRRTLLTLACCAVIGSAGSYYAAFTLLLVGAAGGMAALRTRSGRGALPALAVMVAVTGTLALNIAPSLAYQWRHGPNPEVAQRHPAEAERYGLKLTSLVLPRTHHRVEALGATADHYSTNTAVPSEGGQALGAFGTAGLILLLVGAARRMTDGGPLTPSQPGGTLAFLTLVSLLTGMIGGFSVLIGFLLTPHIRSWNRISIFIAFLGVAACALFLDRLGRRTATLPVLGIILVVALLDQTSTADVPRYSAIAAEWDSDQAFVHAMESRLPPAAMVYQLPYTPFPEEPPPGRMSDYDHFRGYLHSRQLRWSYGAMRGRAADWQASLQGQPAEALATRLASMGFAAIYIDRFGYQDSARALEDTLSQLLGTEPEVSHDGRLSWFPLRP